MTTGIRFPTVLPPPLRAGYGDQPEETRGAFEPEAGSTRRRQRMRSTPRLFTVQWELTQAQYSVFDAWWQDTLKGGALPFDIQLLDDDAALTWFTVYWIGEYDAEVVNVMNWRVSGTLRATAGTFGTTRPAGTDELRGVADIGVGSATGAIVISRALRASADVGVATATGRFSLPALRGVAEVGLPSQPTARLNALPFRGAAEIGVSEATGLINVGSFNSYPEQSRQWMGLDWLNDLAAQDINTAAETVAREWIGV